MEIRQLIETYHNAWTTGDMERARGCLADDLDFRGSIDSFSKADDFVAGLTLFQGMLSRVTILRRFFDNEGGVLLYDCDTATPAGVLRTAEFFRVREGRIAEIRLVFDATELRKLMQP